jgi:hypothetical protein
VAIPEAELELGSVCPNLFHRMSDLPALLQD